MNEFGYPPLEELKALPTRQLMALRKRSWASPFLCECCGMANSDRDKAGQAALEEHRENLKAALSTREHIPNKQESKKASSS